MMGLNGSGWGWDSGLAMLMVLVVLGGLVAFGIWGVTRMTGGGSQFTAPVESPRQILDRRFAAGAIDAEEYAEVRRVLDGGLATGASQHR